MSEKVSPNNPHGHQIDPYPTPSRPPLESLLTTKQKTVRQFISDLNAIYDKIEQQPPAFLHVLKHHELSITCKELRLSEKGLYASKFKPCFFDPATPDVKHHTPIFEPNHHSQLRHESLHKMIDFHMKDTSEARQSAYLLCYEMVWAFDMYPRKGSRDNKRDLRSFTNWLPSRDFDKNAVFENRFKSTLFYSNWSPIAAYIDNKSRPHVLFTMKHDIHPQGEELLRGEALAITAAMITRLERFRSEGHSFVPVLVFSFFGNLQGRILQAYFNGTNLVIFKTKIYNFTTENADAYVDVFMQQMSSTPTGNTKELEQQGVRLKESLPTCPIGK